ncbi:MAG: hypothetical protein Q8P18_26045 [Pseudomonadota bacterium]|nr:hypothetical protein [Pseudomonadota bacterium]
MADRAANATIKGYWYQFDKAILELLGAAATATVTLEGIEDVDVLENGETRTIQCKFHEGTTYSKSPLRAAVLPMFETYLDRSRAGLPSLRFQAYTHFKNRDPGEWKPTRDEFKDILIEDKRHREKDGTIRRETIDHQTRLGATDFDIDAFVALCTFQFALSFQDHRAKLISSLRAVFNCNEDDAKFLYYNAALGEVVRLSSAPSVGERTVARRDFLDTVNRKPLLQASWHREFVGREAYLVWLKRHCKKLGLVSKQKRTVLLLGYREGGAQAGLSFEALVEELLRSWYPLGSAHYQHIPLTVAIQGTAEQLMTTKRALVERRVRFEDAKEDLSLVSDWLVDLPVREVGRAAAKRNKVVRASHQGWVVSANTLRAVRGILDPFRVVLVAGLEGKVSEYIELSGVHSIIEFSGADASADALALIRGV